MRLKFTTLAVALVLGTAALAQDVRYNFDPGTDFSKYKTFKWYEAPGGVKPDQLTDNNIRQAIEAEVAKKGLSKTDGTPDLALVYHVSTNQEKELTTWGSAPGWGYGWRYGGGMTTTTSSTITVGTLVLDMYQAGDKKMVWRGMATKTLNPSKDPEKNRKNLQKAMAKLLKNYPPKEKK